MPDDSSIDNEGPKDDFESVIKRHSERQDLRQSIPAEFWSHKQFVQDVKILVAANRYLVHLQKRDLPANEDNCSSLDQAVRQLVQKIPLTYLNVTETPLNEVEVIGAAKRYVKDLTISASKRLNPVQGQKLRSSRLVEANRLKEGQAKASKKLLPPRAAEKTTPKTFDSLDPCADSSSDSSSSSSSEEEADTATQSSRAQKTTKDAQSLNGQSTNSDRGVIRRDKEPQIGEKRKPGSIDTAATPAKMPRTSLASGPRLRDRNPTPVSPSSASLSSDTDSETVRRRASRFLARTARNTTTTIGQTLRCTIRTMGQTKPPRASKQVARKAETAPTVGTSLPSSGRSKAARSTDAISSARPRVPSGTASRAAPPSVARPAFSTAPLPSATTTRPVPSNTSAATRAAAPAPLVVNGTIPDTSSAIKSRAFESLANLRAAEARRREANATLLQTYRENSTRGNFGRYR